MIVEQVCLKYTLMSSRSLSRRSGIGKSVRSHRRGYAYFHKPGENISIVVHKFGRSILLWFIREPINLVLSKAVLDLILCPLSLL